MRLLGSIADEQSAHALADYLLTLGIESSVEEGAAGWGVWVIHDDHLEQARGEWEQFLADPRHSRYAVAEKAQQIREHVAGQQVKRRARYIDVRTRWASAPAGAMPLTLGLIILSAVVFAAQAAHEENFRPWELLSIANPMRMPPVPPFRLGELTEIGSGQVWRLVSPIFLHGGWMHIVFNMMWLYQLGSLIERRRGTLAMAIIVLASAIPSNLAQYLSDGPAFGGMSGVVYALFGFIWMRQRYMPEQGMALTSDAIWIMLAWLIICMTPLIGNVANSAHLVGLAMGMLMGIAPYAWRKASGRRS